MPPSPDDLVILTDCASTMEATMLRGALESVSIFCYVQGENHRSMLQALGPYIALNLMVKRRDLEAARAFVEDFRSDTARALEDEAGGEDEDDSDDDDGPIPQRSVRTRKAVARLLALVPAFGMGHHYIGAHKVGLFLTGLHATAVWMIATGRPAFGIGLWILATLADLATVGAVVDSQAKSRS